MSGILRADFKSRANQVVRIAADRRMDGLTRLVEADADRSSLEHAKEPDGLARAMVKSIDYRAPSPSALEEFVFYDHPSVEHRIRGAMEWKATHEPTGPAPTP
jgi:STE24 endopeptidase